MASEFLVSLWESIFTPGPTPVLLVATNATFAALQLVFFLLLVATYSIHFVVLSFLCGGLWWAINWFAAELKRVKEEEEARKKTEGIAGGDGSDTDVETIVDDEGPPGSKEVEVLEVKGDLKSRSRSIGGGNKSEPSTEDEWEKVSENEKDK
ncbi:9e48c737-4606-4b85-8311-5b512f1a2827 [Sclerotinia trifoliorum]|uniref:9e48c737-4606-4b85-8311-5b512f1a2827 n=1 Tax=Sclerotinia trifoliorum TaxID=28548 RepID=A0A8H2VVV3_9HELO|nr:9e48c737-4606-4b85-8311-5b512f1a2827 [Sclerotinia trifoliorum]